MEALTCQEDVDDGVNAVSDVNRYTWLVDIKSSKVSNCDHNSAAGMKWPDLAANLRPIISGEPLRSKNSTRGQGTAADRGICV